MIVTVVCFIAGVWAATRWLPPLAEGTIEAIVYFVVCGLAGAVLALIGLHVWDIIHQLKMTERGEGFAEVVAFGLSSLLWEAGNLAALALIAYLLAPKASKANAAAPATSDAPS